VGRYGKHGAYRVAVGVVRKWSQGVNPGGWKTKSGKGKRTHPDVRAAAAKNMAEWEEKRARAHAQHGGHEAKATAVVLAAVQSADEPAGGHAPFPGQGQIALPPVPAGKLPGGEFAAHRLDDLLHDFAHANERLRSAKKDKAQRAYHLMHVNNHLSHALDGAHALAESLKVNYLAEARELELLTQTIGLAKAVNAEAKTATFAHLLQTILYHASHAKRHALLMTGAGPDAVWDFNWGHAVTHSTGAISHCFKLAQHVQDNYPEIASWFRQLEKAEDPDDPYTGLSAATAPGARPFLSPPAPGGRYEQYGLYQHPSQALAPSPLLPPDVKLPTPAEVRAVIPLVPDCSDASLSATARKFLEQAAGKLEKVNPLEALSVLRSAQAALYAAHKADQRAMAPSAYTANVFARVPPAEQSSATTAMKLGTDKLLAWRKAEQALGALTDRIRKKFFHGSVYAGPSQLGRFTEDGMDALDKVLALAGAPVTTGKDVSFPTTSDASGRTPLIEPPEGLLNIADKRAAEELASLPALDKTRVTAYLDRARAMLATNRYGAAQSALRAAVIARESGARHLARHIMGHVQALGDMGNATHAAGEAGTMSSGGKTVSPQHSRQANADTGNRTGLSAVDVVLAAAGSSAGKSAGKSAGAARPPGPRSVVRRPDAHQLHVEHVEHLDHLHHEHVEHLDHLHHEHVAHMEHVEHLEHLAAEGHGGTPERAVRKASTGTARSATPGIRSGW
jgi:hypothetical protein